MIRIRCLLVISLVYLVSCSTYNEKTQHLQGLITSGNFAAADKLMDSNKKGEQGINRVLYFFNRGMIAFMNGEYEKSNAYFMKSDLYIEDYRRSLGNEALALVSNPMVKPYHPEDFEAVMIHYYMALNFIYLNDYEGALVECRRVNLQLQRINDQYKKDKNRYSKDAFAHVLMGLIYEASGDINNAFIAYRNALEIYETDYTKLFNLPPPTQLKKDILRSAKMLGFSEEVDFYERKFNMSAETDDPEDGHLIFFWMNGFGPIKGEWSINFVNTGYNDGWITLANEEHGLSFPIYIGNKPSNEQAAFSDLSMLRVAFPKYIERGLVFNRANILARGDTYELEIVENINAIAFQCLQDRMVREIASGILRLATKKALETTARNENENFGAIVSIINAMTEKADTRNWQSLPYSISYARIPFTPGIHQVQLNATGKASSQFPFEFNIQKGKTTFFAFHHLESN